MMRGLMDILLSLKLNSKALLSHKTGSARNNTHNKRSK
jgi:hypothetical protein